MASLESLFFNLVLLVVVVIPAAVAAPFLERNRMKRSRSHTKPYKWGYFHGLIHILIGGLGSAALMLGLVFRLEGAEVGESILGASILIGCYALPGLFVLRRHRWAWVWTTVASLNPGTWVINSIYGWNRWNEFRDEHQTIDEVTSNDVVMESERVQVLPQRPLWSRALRRSTLTGARLGGLALLISVTVELGRAVNATQRYGGGYSMTFAEFDVRSALLWALAPALILSIAQFAFLYISQYPHRGWRRLTLVAVVAGAVIGASYAFLFQSEDFVWITYDRVVPTALLWALGGALIGSFVLPSRDLYLWVVQGFLDSSASDNLDSQPPS